MPAARLVTYVVAVVLGAVAGLLGSFRFAETAGGWPVGLVLALALTGAALVLAGLVTGSRSGALLAAGAWLVTVFPFSAQRPEGDLVVPATSYGYAWLLGGVVVAGAAALVPYGVLTAAPAAPAGDDQPLEAPSADGAARR